MRRVFLTLLSLAALSLITASVWALCNPYSMNVCCEVLECKENFQTKREVWTAYFELNDYRDVTVFGFAGVSSCQSSNCFPDFDPATVTHDRDSSGRPTWKWVKKVHNKDSNCNRISPPVEHKMNYTCRLEAEEACESGGGSWNFSTDSCDFVGGGGCAQTCTPYQPLESGGCEGNVDYCAYPGAGCPSGFADGGRGCCCGATPIVIDISGDGFSLTSGDAGVRFDMGGDGHRERIAWTAAGSDDAWLALDRDGDGLVTSGRELFGNFTEQPPSGAGRNGFLALAEFDRPASGGNADGVIDGRDAVFASLRLWQDADHDGLSGGGELHALDALDVARLHLDYSESKRADASGNRFRWRAKVEDARGARVGRWAWDVILTTGR